MWERESDSVCHIHKQTNKTQKTTKSNLRFYNNNSQDEENIGSDLTEVGGRVRVKYPADPSPSHLCKMAATGSELESTRE